MMDIPLLFGIYWVTDIMTQTGTGLWSPKDPTEPAPWIFQILINWMALGLSFYIMEGIVLRIKKNIGIKKMVKYTNHILLLGWSKKMYRFLNRLPSGAGVHHNYILLADLEQSPNNIPDFIEFVRGDPQEERSLLQAGIKTAEHAIIMIGNDAETIMVVMTIQSLNPTLKITANLLELENIKHLERLGVKNIVCDEEICSCVLMDVFSKTQPEEFPGSTVIAPELSNLVDKSTKSEEKE
jgi:voltage-gated potassium channel Kch